ncbi:30S ribosomal protein S6e [Candidatus Pacearchaeota archaeon]|nr:30S ribosomal protein S6e [Candidatus Pacearchaeota archaeon]
MTFKINVSHNGKTYKVETENEKLVGSLIGDKIKGEEISEDLTGYEIEITGTSDKAGFTGMVDLEGPNLHKVLLSYGRGMHKKPKGEKKVNKKPKGLRLRKTVRGKEISQETIQINTKVLKEGSKKFETFFEKPETPEEDKKPEN